MPHTEALDAASTFLRLRPDASIEALRGDATFWQRISSGALGDFHNEFLLAGVGYDKDWTHWEMHPNGDEVVCLLSGVVRIMLELSAGAESVELNKPGEYVVVPKG